MKTLFLSVIIALLILFAAWNAFVILWKTANKEKYSKIWHKIGLIARILIYFLPVIIFHNFGDIAKWTLLFISIGGILYDFIINLIRYLYEKAPPLWYVDNKGWNAFFLKFMSPKWYWIARGGFVLVTIIIFLL